MLAIEDLGDDTPLRRQPPVAGPEALKEIADGKILPAQEGRIVSRVKGTSDSVWLERFTPSAPSDPSGAAPPGPVVAVKDLIDVEGSVTTAGCRAVADRGVAAPADATCVAAVRRNGGRLAGKVNLHELAYGVSGINPWFGTPANPADEGRVPGGSSSGSAVAVAIGEADVALGSDTGGSVRIPAACCGVVGLKTTHGRVPLEGVWPLAPSFDTIGPLAADVAGVVAGMALLEGGFEADPSPEGRVGRALLGPQVEIDPVIEAAVDSALRLSELEVTPLEIPGWRDAHRHLGILLSLEALESDGWLVTETRGEGIGEDTLERFRTSRFEPHVVSGARAGAAQWVAELVALVERAGILALPTLPFRPPVVGDPMTGFNLLTAPINLAGLPAISVPVPATGRPAVGLQLVGPRGSEEMLVALAALIEQAVAAGD